VITKQIPTGRSEKFDHYWQTRDYASADARTRQRTAYCARLMRNKSGRLLDVGCGRGYTSIYFARRRFDVLGYDVSPLSVEWTREQGIKAEIVDLENDPVDGEFDVIICLETLQYMRDPVGVLGKLKGALANDGELILSLPCASFIARRLSKLRRAPEEHKYARTVFRPADHRQLIENAALTATDILPVSIVPPRWGILTGPGQLLARSVPSLFALSVMYRVIEK
jgi:2-polyprenyl-3-methyl-5-hydroxy-6-metoxy-1,4-benzoquinol methylase